MSWAPSVIWLWKALVLRAHLSGPSQREALELLSNILQALRTCINPLTFLATLSGWSLASRSNVARKFLHLIWVGRGFEAWKSIIDYCAVEIFNTVSVTDNQIVQMSTLAVSGVICCPMLLFDNDAAAAAFGWGDAVAGLQWKGESKSDHQRYWFCLAHLAWSLLVPCEGLCRKPGSWLLGSHGSWRSGGLLSHSTARHGEAFFLFNLFSIMIGYLAAALLGVANWGCCCWAGWTAAVTLEGWNFVWSYALLSHCMLSVQPDIFFSWWEPVEVKAALLQGRQLWFLQLRGDPLLISGEKILETHLRGVVGEKVNLILPRFCLHQ